jgi:hypothetical protein
MKQTQRILIGLIVLAGLLVGVNTVFARPAMFDSLQASSLFGSSSSEVEFMGRLEVMTPLSGSQAVEWMIAGRTVQVSAGTEIKGSLAIGEMVKVHARVMADGILVAREIESAAGAGTGTDDGVASGNEIEFYGTVQEITTSTWMISGKQVTILNSTEIKGSLTVGDMVKVHALAQDDGSWVAREIELAAGDDGEDGSKNSSDDDLNDDLDQSNDDDRFDGSDDNSNDGSDDNPGDDMDDNSGDDSDDNPDDNEDDSDEYDDDSGESDNGDDD